MNQSIDIKGIIEAHNFDIDYIATELYPNNAFPRLALNRVIAGSAYLNSLQIAKLSEITGIAIEDLFSNNGWKIKSKNNVMTFEYVDFLAELDMSQPVWTTKLFKKGELKSETVLHSSQIVLSSYLDQLNEIIKS